MARRFDNAEASRWLEIDLALDEALADPTEVGVAGFTSPKAWRALIYLVTRPAAEALYAEVLAHCRVPQSTLARLLRELEQVRYVTRTFEGANHEVLLKATTDGRDAVGKIFFHASKLDI
jgi:DNA-binding MarR family transcriptional regulator